MKALLLSEYSRLELTDLPMPRPLAGEVLVKVAACGICGSDVHGYDGSTGRRIPPIVMGHEAAGTVAALGPETNLFHEGDRVTFDSTIYCGACEFCLQGQVNLCDRREVLGVSIPDYRRPGAFADFVSVPERVLHSLPDGLLFEHAALVEPLAVAVHAIDLAQPTPGSAALVVGAGTIGLLVVGALKATGCDRIYVVDIDEGRLGLARELGATQALNPKTCDVAEEIRKSTRGQGVEVAFEAVGSANTIRTAIDSVRKAGTVVLIGNVSPTVEIPLQVVVSRQLRLLGSAASAGEYPRCIRMLADGAINVTPLISMVAPLREGPLWFERLHAREPNLMKVILTPGQE